MPKIALYLVATYGSNPQRAKLPLGLLRLHSVSNPCCQSTYPTLKECRMHPQGCQQLKSDEDAAYPFTSRGAALELALFCLKGRHAGAALHLKRWYIRALMPYAQGRHPLCSFWSADGKSSAHMRPGEPRSAQIPSVSYPACFIQSDHLAASRRSPARRKALIKFLYVTLSGISPSSCICCTALTEA